MPKYKVLSPVKVNGEIIKSGEVELAAKHGDPLCDGVHLAPADTSNKEPEGDKGGKSGKKASK